MRWSPGFKFVRILSVLPSFVRRFMQCAGRAPSGACVAAAILTALAARPGHVFAQGTARSMDIETSIRAAGMGGATAGVWWGEPGVWGNPAALANTRGIGWLDGRTQLVPGLASNVHFDSQRWLIGGGGIGLSFMGEPLEGLGKLRLDYGASSGTDPFGNPTGTFNSFEQVDAWGVGISPLRLFDTLRRLRRGGPVPAARSFDVTLGLQHKHTTVALIPSALAGGAEADCYDWGTAARFSLLPDNSPTAPAHLDVSAGFAVLNANDAQFVFLNEDQASPPSRIRRLGCAVHAALPSPWSGGTENPVRLLVAQVHLLELGFGFDSERITAGGVGPGYNVNRFGLEATLLGVLTGRIGHITDRTGEIVDNTSGYGIRIPIGRWGSVAYDHASVPQASGSGLPDVQRKGWSAWVDPARIWSSTRGSR